MAPKEGSERHYQPIAAAETGPGPGTYMLPTNVGTSVNKDAAPKYSIKLPLKNKYNDAPGPNYRPDDFKLPPVTIKGRTFYHPKALVTPGPNQYNQPKPTVYDSSPAYTIGTRTKYRKQDQIPPSTRYTLPTLTGGKNPVSKSEPQWSMSFIKPKHSSSSYDASQAPGPAAYTVESVDKYKTRQPHYSMAARITDPKDKTAKPGPGQYNPGNLNKAPSFSMGVRHSQYVLPVLTAADIF